MIFLISLLVFAQTVLGQDQLAAIAYLDSTTCSDLESDVSVELWINERSSHLQYTNVVINSANLEMKKLTLTNGMSCSGDNCDFELKKITSASISPIGGVLDVITTKLETKELIITDGNVTKTLDYETLKKLLSLLTPD